MENNKSEFKESDLIMEEKISSVLLLKNWHLVNLFSIYKEEVQLRESKTEYIYSYAHAVDVLANELNSPKYPSGVKKVLSDNSLVIPFLYLVRHTTELSLKFFQETLNIKVKHTHNLNELWNAIKERISVVLPEDISKAIDTYIAVINKLDQSGTELRYSYKDENKVNNSRAKCINAEMFNRFIQKMIVPSVKMIKEYRQ